MMKRTPKGHESNLGFIIGMELNEASTKDYLIVSFKNIRKYGEKNI